MTTEHKAAVKEKIEALGLPFNEEIYKDIDAMMSSSSSQFEYLSKLSAALNEKPASEVIKQMENNIQTTTGCPRCGYTGSATKLDYVLGDFFTCDHISYLSREHKGNIETVTLAACPKCTHVFVNNIYTKVPEPVKEKWSLKKLFFWIK